MWATLLVTEMVEIHTKKASQPCTFYVAEVQQLFDHTLERRERELEEEEEMKGGSGSQEGIKGRKKDYWSENS